MVEFKMIMNGLQFTLKTTRVNRSKSMFEHWLVGFDGRINRN